VWHSDNIVALRPYESALRDNCLNGNTKENTMINERKMPPATRPVKNILDMLELLRNIRGDLLGILVDGFKEYGDLYMFEIKGQPLQYMMAHPDHIQEVTVKQADKFIKSPDYSDRRKGIARFLGSGLLTSDGEFWKRQRKLVAPALHARRIEAYAQTMVDSTLKMLDGWQGRAEVDVDEDMMKTTLAIVARSLFNVDISGEARKIGDAMAVMQNMFGATNGPEALLPWWIPTPQRFAARRAVRDLNEIVYRMICERRQTNEDLGDLLSMLMLARDDAGQGMTDEQVRDEAVTMFLAGHDTTANTLNWTWVLLAQHPEIEARLHAEIDRVLAGRTPTLADLKQLPYVERVIKESMRLYPPAFTFSRAAAEDTQVGDYFVPKDTVITVVSYYTHRHPDWWDEPEKFMPERFEHEKNLHRYAYIPFGAGPRVCIGNSFAMMEAQLMLATIAQRYQLRLAPGQAVEPEPLLTLRPKGGLKMRVQERERVLIAAGG
jgi:cytochrome P450